MSCLLGSRGVPNPNRIQDYYLWQVVRNGEVNLVNTTIATIFQDHADAYAELSEME